MPVADLFQEAVELQQRGRLRDAAQRHVSVLRQQPDHFGSLQFLGMIEAQLGHMDRAERLLARAVALRSSAPECRNNYGIVLHGLGRYADAIEQYRQALALNPGYAVAHNNLGNALAAMGRHEEAVAQFRQALAIEPRYVEALNNLGSELLALGRPDEAAEQLRAALLLRPGFPAALLNLANTHAALLHHEEAAGAFRELLAVQPDHAAAHVGLANALRATGRASEAVVHCRRAAELQPALADAHGVLGLALQELGRIDEARAAFERAIELDPGQPNHYLKLAGTTRLAADDPRLAALQAMAAAPETLAVGDRVALHFALGQLLAGIGRNEQSFQHLLLGNSLHRQRLRYQEERAIRRLARTPAVFTPQTMQRLSGAGEAGEQPVFIVGMPRSGSTLVEQVLASHPKVYGAGEVMAFRDALARLVDYQALPDCVADMTPDDVRRLGASYIAGLAGHVTGGAAPERITDKLPANFRYAGLIHLALPNARIIHTRRDPIDTCLSCFSVLFERQPFTYDLAELGRYHRAYERLMAHWREVLPAGVMLEVRYEDMVNDFEAQARRLVEFCGLEWNDACLEFHRAERPVRTASVVQVRQPLYRSAVGRWRPDDATLRPLLDALAGD